MCRVQLGTLAGLAMTSKASYDMQVNTGMREVWGIIKNEKFAQVLWCDTIQCPIGYSNIL